MGLTKMCEKTVEGSDVGIRTVPNTDDVGERTVPGTDTFNNRNISGEPDIAPPIVLLGTTPTFTEISFGATSYTSPPGCIYIQVYVIGYSGDGTPKGTLAARHGAGGGGGGVAMNFFKSGTYECRTNSVNPYFGPTGNRLQVLSATDGVKADNSTTTYRGGDPGTSVNSVHTFGCKSARSPGDLGGDGGANFVHGLNGRGYFAPTNTDINDGLDGIRTGGGGGATMNTASSSRGTGTNGNILVIEYY